MYLTDQNSSNSHYKIDQKFYFHFAFSCMKYFLQIIFIMNWMLKWPLNLLNSTFLFSSIADRKCFFKRLVNFNLIIIFIKLNVDLNENSFEKVQIAFEKKLSEFLE